jgi:uncharacterized SAM-binding protein YcdF (DUF218 family)
MFIVGKILAALVFPPGLYVALGIVCCLLAWRGRRKAAMVVAASSAALLYLLSTGLVANLLLAPLENAYPPLSSAQGARAVVVLGGGYNDLSPEYGRGVLTPISEKRAVYGLELADRYGLPLVFSGGKGLDSGTAGSEAEAAGDLWRRLGVSADRISLETESVDTKANARGVVSLAGKGPFLLVTSAFHMPRAMLAFEKTGASVIAAPTDYRVKRRAAGWVDLLPDTYQLDLSRTALHEYVGLLYYRLTM